MAVMAKRLARAALQQSLSKSLHCMSKLLLIRLLSVTLVKHLMP